MQIVQLSGGLGNQLFQYAQYLKFKKFGYETYLDDTSCYKTAKDRNNQLKMIGLSYEVAKNDDILRLTDTDRHLNNWIRRRFTGSKDVIKHEGDTVSEDGYWIGYWQSASDFAEVEEELRNLVFGKDFSDQGIDLDVLERIEKSNSVSIHIRRGDYLNPDVQSVYGNICTDEYYQSAISYIREHIPNCTLFIFSNDPEWVKDNIKGEDVVVMEGNDEEHGYRDMFLMSKCKHNIIANSSFSWWGSWLNTNSDKIVIGPSVWIHRDGFDKIYKNLDMIRIDKNGEILNEE